MIKRMSEEEMINDIWDMIGKPSHFTYPDAAEAADALIQRNFDINKEDQYGRTVLSSVTASEPYKDSSKDNLPKYFKLLDIGARLSSAQMVGCTLLTAAIEIPSLTLVKAYLERGMEPNERDGRGYTPLLSAAHCWGSKHNLLLLNTLLENGVDITAEDPEGNTALEILLLNDWWARRRAAKYLAENGATLSEKHIELLPLLQERVEIEEDRKAIAAVSSVVETEE
jgi:ankyrin repeat protein